MPGKDNSFTKYINEFLHPEAGSVPRLIIFSEIISERLKYALDFIFNKGLQISYSVTNNENEFSSSVLPKINYSLKKIENTFQIEPGGLLFESDIKNNELTSFKKNDLIYFFPVKTGYSSYDIFSSVFYFISRYEEWLPFEADVHGRFELNQSILFKHNFHKVPVVDHWIEEFKTMLRSKYKTLNFPTRAFKYLSTIDVDNVYAYKAKPWYRVGGALLKDIFKLDLKNFTARINTVCFKKPGPFDEYDLQMETSKKSNIPLIYFFLYRNNTKYDRTIDPDHPEFIKLLKNISNNNIEIGIHPSYKSSEEKELMKNEVELLNKNSEKRIICSRQHYLRFNIRTTPIQLIENGIKYDFTMGFASGAGFRAGTTLPFNNFDLKNNITLQLVHIPFVIMDGAYFVYNKINIADSENEIMTLKNRVKEVNGLFVTVFHERTFSQSLYPGWMELYFKIHN